jgi:pimeloyl-ACP methyl ester carboxylesterase
MRTFPLARLRAAAVALPAIVVVTVIGLPAAGAATGAATGAAPSTAQASDRTSPAEAQRVDRVKLPLDWFDCSTLTLDRTPAECATATFPLDYDQPKGTTTQVAVMRLKARDPARRIGTLFLNPGGPGGSGVRYAAEASRLLSADVLDRFDVVGFDPRGTNLSDPVRCWKDVGQRAAAITSMLAMPFPATSGQTAAYVSDAKAFGKACSTTGRPISGAMSTAQVARDMDVLRRTLGDRQLTYLGLSYGTYLGVTYANMFPDRVRAIVADGNLDPVAWAGTPATKDTPQTARLRSGEGSDKALRELLTRCRKAGPDYCTINSLGDPLAVYESLVAETKAITGTPRADELGLDYPTFVAVMLAALRTSLAGDWVDLFVNVAWSVLHGSADEVSAAKATLATIRGTTARAAADRQAMLQKLQVLPGGSSLAVAWPYDNSWEAEMSVLCSDGLNPVDAGSWPRVAAAQEVTAPGFGPLWTWVSAPCASNTWTVTDPDVYRGPFTRRTANPVLVVGAYWDPATNYDSSVAVSKLLPNSRLLSNDNWGHTSYGTSACDTQATDRYLLDLALPAAGTVCSGDDQPYTTPLDPTPMARGNVPAIRPMPKSNPKLPPVGSLIPGIPDLR